MYRLKISSTKVEIDAECDWPEGDSFLKLIREELELDSIYIHGREMTVKEFAEKWKITKFYKFGRYPCSGGYEDYINPENSYSGHNPKLLKWLEELEDVQEE